MRPILTNALVYVAQHTSIAAVHILVFAVVGSGYCIVVIYSQLVLKANLTLAITLCPNLNSNLNPNEF